MGQAAVDTVHSLISRFMLIVIMSTSTSTGRRADDQFYVSRDRSCTRGIGRKLSTLRTEGREKQKTKERGGKLKREAVRGRERETVVRRWQEGRK